MLPLSWLAASEYCTRALAIKDDEVSFESSSSLRDHVAYWSSGGDLSPWPDSRPRPVPDTLGQARI